MTLLVDVKKPRIANTRGLNQRLSGSTELPRPPGRFSLALDEVIIRAELFQQSSLEGCALDTHHAFLFISLLSLHDYDVKMPQFTFYGERNAPIKVNPGGGGGAVRAKEW